MGRTAALAVLWFGAAGCGDNLVQPTWWEDSARMRVRAWATDAGYRYVFGWRDTLLDVTCAADAPACAPLVQAYFSDASCRDFVAASAGALPPIAMYRDSNGGHGVVIDGPPYSGQLYFRRAGCKLAGETDPNFQYATARPFPEVLESDIEELELGNRYHFPDLAYVALANATAIADAEAVLDIEIEAGPARLRTRYLLDGDIALAAGIHDAVFGVRCWPCLDATGQLRCRPALEVPIFAPGTAFADAACSVPIDAALYVAAGFAAAGDGYVRVDTPVDGPAFVRAGTACTSAGSAPLWRGGELLAASSFEAMFVEEVLR